MKKLISKNPVQRFKIIKAEQGVKVQQGDQTLFEKVGKGKIKTNNHGHRYYVNARGNNIFENGDIYDTSGKLLHTDPLYRKQYNEKQVQKQKSWDDYVVSQALKRRDEEYLAARYSDLKRRDEEYLAARYPELQKSNNQKSTTKKLQNSTTNKRPNQSSTNSVKAVPKNQINVTTPSRVQKRVNTVTSPRFKNIEIQKGWTRNYGNELWNKITDEQKNILKSTGQFTDDSFKDAKSLQTALNNYFKINKNGSLNTDDTLSQIAVDNKWGDQSQRAFDEALSAAQYQQYSPSFTVTSNYIPYYPNAQMLVAPKISLSTPTYDRSGIRNVLREFNLRPYSYSGAQRKALRMMANNTGNDNDKLLVRQMNLPQTLLERLKISLKKGGLIKV